MILKISGSVIETIIVDAETGRYMNSPYFNSSFTRFFRSKYPDLLNKFIDEIINEHKRKNIITEVDRDCLSGWTDPYYYVNLRCRKLEPIGIHLESICLLVN